MHLVIYREEHVLVRSLTDLNVVWHSQDVKVCHLMYIQYTNRELDE